MIISSVDSRYLAAGHTRSFHGCFRAISEIFSSGQGIYKLNTGDFALLPNECCFKILLQTELLPLLRLGCTTKIFNKSVRSLLDHFERCIRLHPKYHFKHLGQLENAFFKFEEDLMRYECEIQIFPPYEVKNLTTFKLNYRAIREAKRIEKAELVACFKILIVVLLVFHFLSKPF